MINYNTKFTDFLESLVGHRFSTQTELELYIDKFLHKENYTHLEHCSCENDDDFDIDFDLIGSYETRKYICDYDIYYILDRKERLYITEVGYEFMGGF